MKVRGAPKLRQVLYLDKPVSRQRESDEVLLDATERDVYFCMGGLILRS